MKLIDAFQDEHVLIDQMLGSFRTYVDGLVDGTADPDDGRRFAAFFTEFAGHFHHDREEGALIDALVTDAELPGDRGPVYALARQLRALAVRYSHALWRHIDAENSVLFPQGEERLVQCGIRELADRPMSEAEAAAREGAAALLVGYPPVEDDALTRGDGCFMCRAHGETCAGLEAEWWTELEWQEFYARD